MATDFSEPEPLVMEIVYLKTSKLNEVLHQIIERGLDIDGQHYIFYTSTTNQMKSGESILLKEDFYKEHEQEIMLGLTDHVVNAKGGWSKVTDAAQNEENKQAAIQLWGKNYAKIILDARQNDLQNFETNYLLINDRINDNQGAIDSLDELINIHEQKKQSYEDLTTAMENEELKRELNRELSRTWEQYS